MFLNSLAGKIALYPNDIVQFRVWVAPPEIQANLRHAVEKNCEQKQRAVEIVIEADEQAALMYLSEVQT